MSDLPTSIVGGLLIGFLFGSIPFGYILVRLKTGADVRDSGSGNIGATNVSRALGVKGGVLTLLLDALKGALGVWVAAWIGANVFAAAQWLPPTWVGSRSAGVVYIFDTAWPWAGALGAVLGHCYTPWLSLRGGKGVATLLGAFGAAAPGPTAIAAVVLGLTAAAGRMMSLASLCGAVALPLALALWGSPQYPSVAAAAAALAALVIFWRHRANIGRIVRGEERKLGSKTT